MKQLAVLLLAFMFTVGAPKNADSSSKTAATLVTIPGGAYIPVTSATEATADTALKAEPTTSVVTKTESTEATTETVVEESNPPETNATEAEFTEPDSFDSYTDYDLDLLARVMTIEAGCDWMPDEIPLMVGAVVLNRKTSDLYPDNIHDIIFQDGQYDTAHLYDEDKEPTPRIKKLAQDLLENGFQSLSEKGFQVPPEVLGQNGYGCVNGCGDDLYYEYHDETLGTTIYFTYIYS